MVTQAWTLRRGSSVTTLDVFGVNVKLIPGAEEAGCSLAWIEAEPGMGAPMHRHKEAECFHVLRGELTAEVDGVSVKLAPGDSVIVQPWAAHRFVNESAEVVEFLALGTPKGHEEFFRDADRLARSGGFNPSSAAVLCEKHGIELVQ
jgi:quercetin dioxygenase-like cupin family protein